MTTIPLGILRHIERFGPEDAADVANWQRMIETNAPGAALRPFGSVNGMDPLAIDEAGRVLVLDMGREIRVVATSVTQFDSILRDVLGIWAKHQNAPMLPINEVREEFEILVELLKDLDGVDAAWWAHFAFRELTVHIRV